MVLRNILESNEADAAVNRDFFTRKKIATVNMMSSPGSGKTELIGKTIDILSSELNVGVIEGDICTSMDSERLASRGIQVVQINTEPFGGDCHLEASMVKGAASLMDLGRLDLIFVENVGNLVCPAEFDLGVDSNVVVLSVTEGEDKPLKYPLMFRTCDLCILSKTDLLGVLDYNADTARMHVLKINPRIEIIELSAKTSSGMDGWISFLKNLVFIKKNSNCSRHTPAGE